MTTQVHPTAPAPPELGPSGFDDFEELAPRPRRRLVTPLNAGLVAILITAVGFLAGVLVEKGQAGGTAASAGGARRALTAGGAGAGAGAGAARGAAAAAGATVGTISSIDGHTLYLTDTQGTTIKVT
ncbi:MAG: hypothetical protein QOE44_2515, partial [Solirubrobacteraceae bacterium]|nr:hypothetical protein [Solirubrobacteraceae bacterium]